MVESRPVDQEAGVRIPLLMMKKEDDASSRNGRGRRTTQWNQMEFGMELLWTSLHLYAKRYMERINDDRVIDVTA